MQMTQLRCREDLQVISDDSKPAGVPVMQPTVTEVDHRQLFPASLETPGNPDRHRRRSDWNSEGGTHGGTYYKSPAVEAKKHIFLHCNASNLVLKILQHDKIWGRQSLAPNSGELYPP